MNIYTQRGGRCEDKTVFDKHGFFSGNSSQAQNLIIIKSLRLCCSEMFVLNVCIPLSFPRVLKTFSSTSSGISYLESIEEKASWRLHERKVCKYSISWIKKRGFSLSGATSSPGRFSLALEVGRPTSKAGEKRPGDEVVSGGEQIFIKSRPSHANHRCRPGVSISVSSEETTPIFAATVVNFCFGLGNNLDGSFYNWLVYNQTQWTRSVTHHWNMLKPAVKSSWAEYLFGYGEHGLWTSLDVDGLSRNPQSLVIKGVIFLWRFCPRNCYRN